MGLALAAVPIAGRKASAQSNLGLREWVRSGVERDQGGGVIAVFGLQADLAREVLLPATRADALPEGYVPSDLASAAANGIPSAGRQLIRTLILDDSRNLVQAAQSDGQQLYVGSGFRSQAYQVDVFAAQVARWGDEDIANRYSARPGHSQHQLGTTIDFTTEFRTFRATVIWDDRERSITVWEADGESLIGMALCGWEVRTIRNRAGVLKNKLRVVEIPQRDNGD